MYDEKNSYSIVKEIVVDNDWIIQYVKMILSVGNYRKTTIFVQLLGNPSHLERWQSGRLRRSWKPLNWEVPGVRIPLSPLKTFSSSPKDIWKENYKKRINVLIISD